MSELDTIFAESNRLQIELTAAQECVLGQIKRVEAQASELERVNKSAAEMRDALQAIAARCSFCGGTGIEYGKEIECEEHGSITAALSSDAGTGYVRKEHYDDLRDAAIGLVSAQGHVAQYNALELLADVLDQIKEPLAGGRKWVRAEDVQPLVVALKETAAYYLQFSIPGPREYRVDSALAHAKEKGFA